MVVSQLMEEIIIEESRVIAAEQSEIGIQYTLKTDSTPNSCHTIECESHQSKFGVLCTPSHGVTVSWCA